MCLYHSKTLMVKQGIFLYESWPDLAEKRDILNTGNLEYHIGIMFIGELLVTTENRTLHFLDSDIFVDGRTEEKRVGKLEIN